MRAYLIIETDSTEDIAKALTYILRNPDVIKPKEVKDKIKVPAKVKVASTKRECGRPDCHVEFTPKRESTKFCSKKCYMDDFYERNRKPKAKKPRNNKSLKQEADEILNKIREEIPIKETERPVIYHDC